jgi:hypothetical protein
LHAVKAVLQAGKRWDMLRSLLPAGHRDRALDLLPAGSTTPQLLWSRP